MSYLKGKLKRIIFQNESNGYLVALFRIKETDDEALLSKINKTITITGIFSEANLDINIKLKGKYLPNEKYGLQYLVDSYEVEVPTTKEAIMEFLASSFIASCGEKTAKKIVDFYGEETLNKIKESQENLLKIKGITPARAEKIYNSLLNYNRASEIIIQLKNYGFTMEECSKIYNKFKERLNDVLGDYFYDLKEIIDFTRLDKIYLQHFGNTVIRINACLVEALNILSFNNGDTYSYQEEITNILVRKFNLILSDEEFLNRIDDLIKKNEIVKIERRYYLKSYYEEEVVIANHLKKINDQKITKFKLLDEKLTDLEKSLKIVFNSKQKEAILTSLNNNITIISGGPGTGKTTIVNAIVRLYISLEKLAPLEVMETIALLAPTGRASKKLSTSTNLPAYTIHRYLKWYKDSNSFFYNEFNKTDHKLIIIDEASMIDVSLFAALLKGLKDNVKLILVGDVFQLPSVGPGLVLNDLITSDYFNYILLNEIYRQSEGSYIPYLAKDIKEGNLGSSFLTKKDDYAFFKVSSPQIIKVLEEVIKASQTKKIAVNQLQVLAPKYKGENGIDNLNMALQNIYNPPSLNKNEITYNDVIYRENDKVLQLVNNLDNNIFNGDIGYIKNIDGSKVSIDFDGNQVIYERKDLKEIKHAYAISIHKSQGSEFDHVIMPICFSYYQLLYNKLIYTGISRAKKSLTIIGEENAFIKAVQNNYSSLRKTSLKERLDEVYIKNNCS